METLAGEILTQLGVRVERWQSKVEVFGEPTNIKSDVTVTAIRREVQLHRSV